MNTNNEKKQKSLSEFKAQIDELHSQLRNPERMLSYPYKVLGRGLIWDNDVRINKLLNPLIDEYNALIRQ